MSKERILTAYKKICKSGLVILTWGNVSCREEDTIFITPSGVSVDDLTKDKIVEVKLEELA